jgi:choline-glycine betaine transporter
MKMKTSLTAFVHSLGLAAVAVTTGTTSVMQMKKSRFVSAGFVRAIMILIIVSFVSGISAEMDNQVSGINAVIRVSLTPCADGFLHAGSRRHL